MAQVWFMCGVQALIKTPSRTYRVSELPAFLKDIGEGALVRPACSAVDYLVMHNLALWLCCSANTA